jgi:ubiquinone/menaquinone biosynthesis C-methylase UbiE
LHVNAHTGGKSLYSLITEEMENLEIPKAVSNRQTTDHKKVAEFYNNVYYKDATSHVCNKPSRHLYRLAERIEVKPGNQVLDIACGTGDWLQVVAGRNGLPSGIDISSEAIRVCRQRLKNGNFEVCVAEKLPFADNTFDIVTCLGSLEHFLDQSAALREMVRVAKPDARVVILVPNSGFLTHRLGLYKGTHQVAVRETLRTLDEWQQMFTEQGLKIEQRWKDLHVLNISWINRPPYYLSPLRFLQAIMLLVWPLKWQYQVYNLCRITKE